MGATLTANGGNWTATPDTLSYQWLRNNSDAIAGATGGTYTATTADIGSGLAVRVTASKHGHADVTATSAATAPVTPAPVAPTLVRQNLASAVVGLAYNQLITAGGNPSPTLAITDGTLPPGITLAANGH